MIKIGLTGPTGAGKSTVAEWLLCAGVPVIDSDKVAREITLPGQPTLSVLAEAFGKDILLPDGSLDRKKLAERAFSDPDSTARLNAITHPAITERVKTAFATYEAAGEKAVVLDAPLLFESTLDRVCDHTVAVLAPESVRLARIRARDSLSEDAAKTRMSAQPGDGFYTARAEIILHNDGDPDALKRQTEELLSRIAGWTV